jgi:hypothetical protein
VRRLKTQLGAEGLTLSATREMIDELSKALDATARALRELDDSSGRGGRGGEAGRPGEAGGRGGRGG